MVGSGELTDTYLELFGPDDAFLVSDDNSGEGNFALIAGYMLPGPAPTASSPGPTRASPGPTR